jgi:hypothetical protein
MKKEIETLGFLDLFDEDFIDIDFEETIFQYQLKNFEFWFISQNPINLQLKAIKDLENGISQQVIKPEKFLPISSDFSLSAQAGVMFSVVTNSCTHHNCCVPVLSSYTTDKQGYLANIKPSSFVRLLNKEHFVIDVKSLIKFVSQM